MVTTMLLIDRRFPSDMLVKSRPVADAIGHLNNAGEEGYLRNVKLRVVSELTSLITFLIYGRELGMFLPLRRFLQIVLKTLVMNRLEAPLPLSRFPLVTLTSMLVSASSSSLEIQTKAKLWSSCARKDCLKSRRTT